MALQFLEHAFQGEVAVSMKRTSALGLSRLNASAPRGRKNGHSCPRPPRRRPFCAEIFLELGIEPTCWHNPKQVKLDLIIARPGQQRGVEFVASGAPASHPGRI